MYKHLTRLTYWFGWILASKRKQWKLTGSHLFWMAHAFIPLARPHKLLPLSLYMYMYMCTHACLYTCICACVVVIIFSNISSVDDVVLIYISISVQVYTSFSGHLLLLLCASWNFRLLRDLLPLLTTVEPHNSIMFGFFFPCSLFVMFVFWWSRLTGAVNKTLSISADL